MTISIQGYKGSFHDIAASELFQGEHEILERKSFSEVFSDVDAGRCDWGIVAIENSIAGSIYENYDLLSRYHGKLQIRGEYYLPIHHQLMVLTGTSLKDVEEVWSHPMALKQCETFLRTLKAKVVEKEDTALAAKLVQEEDRKNVAVVASQLAARMYGLQIIAPNIESDGENYTRFLLLKRDSVGGVEKPEGGKASIVTELAHTPGALCGVLNIFAEHQANLTKIESRPIVGRPWEYRFYIDYELEKDGVQHDVILSVLRKSVHDLKLFGIYKSGLKNLYERTWNR